MSHSPLGNKSFQMTHRNRPPSRTSTSLLFWITKLLVTDLRIPIVIPDLRLTEHEGQDENQGNDKDGNERLKGSGRRGRRCPAKTCIGRLSCSLLQIRTTIFFYKNSTFQENKSQRKLIEFFSDRTFLQYRRGFIFVEAFLVQIFFLQRSIF